MSVNIIIMERLIMGEMKTKMFFSLSALTGAAVTTAVLGGGLYTMMRRPEKQGQMMKARVASQFITLSILVIGAGIARYF